MSETLNNFFDLSGFMGISETLKKGVKANPVKGKSYGAKKIPTKIKGATQETEIDVRDQATSPIVVGFSVKKTIVAKDMEKIRKTLNLSQKEVGDILGVSLSTIQKIEQGEDFEHRREFVLRFYELMSLSKFIAKRVSTQLVRNKLFSTPLPNFSAKTILEFCNKLEKDVRIYHISGQLRRQFG